MFYCTFHPETILKGLNVFQITLGNRSILVCNVCAQNFREHGIQLSGL